MGSLFLDRDAALKFKAVSITNKIVLTFIVGLEAEMSEVTQNMDKLKQNYLHEETL